MHRASFRVTRHQTTAKDESLEEVGKWLSKSAKHNMRDGNVKCVRRRKLTWRLPNGKANYETRLGRCATVWFFFSKLYASILISFCDLSSAWWTAEIKRPLLKKNRVQCRVIDVNLHADQRANRLWTDLRLDFSRKFTRIILQSQSSCGKI